MLLLNTSPKVLYGFIDNSNIFNFIGDIDMLCYNNCYLLRLRLKTLGQGSNPEVSVLTVVLKLAKAQT